MADPTGLIGKWAFERVIEDLATGGISDASGVCELSREAPGVILWRERATLRHGGRELEASREMRIEHDCEGWHVKFADGRYFHPWTPGKMAVHHCGADLYEGVIELGLGDATEAITSWQMTWRVRGPAKNLRIKTQLHPCASAQTALGMFTHR